MWPEAGSVCGLKLVVYAALSYYCMRSEATATTVCGLKLLVYAALSFCIYVIFLLSCGTYTDYKAVLQALLEILGFDRGELVQCLRLGGRGEP